MSKKRFRLFPVLQITSMHRHTSELCNMMMSKAPNYSLLIYLVLLTLPAHSQEHTNFGAGIRPSDKELPIPIVPQSKSGIVIPPQLQEKQSARDQSRDRQNIVELDTIIIEDNTVFPNEELHALAKPYLNKPISVDELEELRRSITNHYVNNGYITSGVTFPPVPSKKKRYE